MDYSYVTEAAEPRLVSESTPGNRSDVDGRRSTDISDVSCRSCSRKGRDVEGSINRSLVSSVVDVEEAELRERLLVFNSLFTFL